MTFEEYLTARVNHITEQLNEDEEKKTVRFLLRYYIDAGFAILYLKEKGYDFTGPNLVSILKDVPHRSI